MPEPEKQPPKPDVTASLLEEERLRLQIRAQLASETGTKSPPLTMWAILNSQFTLFILGAIFVSGLGGLFTYWHQQQHEQEIKIDNARKLLAEFDFRLINLDTAISQIAATENKNDKAVIGIYVWREVQGDTAYQPAIPEFKNFHWAGIVLELDALGFGANTSEIVRTLHQLEDGEGTVSLPNNYHMFVPGYLETRSEMLHKFSDTAWHKLDPRHRPSLTPNQ